MKAILNKLQFRETSVKKILGDLSLSSLNKVALTVSHCRLKLKMRYKQKDDKTSNQHPNEEEKPTVLLRNAQRLKASKL